MDSGLIVVSRRRASETKGEKQYVTMLASWSRQAGVDIDTLADLMGHKDTRMTRRYAHIGPTHLASAVGLLEQSYQRFSTNLAQATKKGLAG